MRKALKRFVDIWKIDFLAKFFAGEKNDTKTTAIFWILSSLILSTVLALSFCFFLCQSSDELISAIEENVPQGARITVTDGQLTTENIEEPFFREINAQNGGSGYDENYVVIIDTHSSTYDITSLDEYSGGVIISGDRVYIKDGAEFNHFVFSEGPDFTVSKDDAINFVNEYFIFPISIVLTGFIGIFMFMWLAVFRLVAAFWWAIMLFVLIKIVDVECKYMTAYKAVLNFYFIPTLVVFIIGSVGWHFPLMTTTVFAVIFVANLIWIKKNPEKNEDATVLNEIPEIKKVEAVKQTEEK